MSKLRLVGVFSDEHKMVHAAHVLQQKGVNIEDIFTPFPVHGLDSLLGIKRSRLPIVCFFIAITGLILGTYFQIWTMAIDWPVIIGGKPFASLPAFVPVSFEFMVLSAGLGTVATFFYRSKLYPGKTPMVLSPKVTNDQFVILADASTAQVDYKLLVKLMTDNGAVSAEVRECEI